MKDEAEVWEELTPFEQIALQRIRRISPEVERGSQFQTLLVIHPVGGECRGPNILFERKADPTSKSRLGQFNSYAFMLECQLEEQGLQLSISFDSGVIESRQVERIAQQLESVLRQVCEPKRRVLAEVETISDQDLCDLWRWNATAPETANICVNDLITETAQAQPDAAAVEAWDGRLTYRELDTHSSRLASYLTKFGVTAKVIVPLWFEKSMWTPVAMLAVMKAGGASVAIDLNQPEERLYTIVQQLEPMLVLSSAANERFAGRLANCMVVVVDGVHLTQLDSPTDIQLPAVSSSDRLYVVFTSGSTGTLKGVVVTHSNFSSAARHQQ